MAEESRKIGDLCDKGHPLERRTGMFFWQGQFYDGAYCKTCNALWAIKCEEMPPLRPLASSDDN